MKHLLHKLSSLRLLMSLAVLLGMGSSAACVVRLKGIEENKKSDKSLVAVMRSHVSQPLQSVKHVCDILRGFQTGKRAVLVMCCSDIVLHGLYIAGVGEEGVARRTIDIGIHSMGGLHEFVCQPFPIALREGEAANIAPKMMQCYG